MKRGMKITLGGIVLLLAVLLLLPKLYERQAEAFIRSAAAALRGELRVGRLDIGLLRSFPRATVTLRDVVFVGDGIFAGDTLLTAERISAASSPLQLLEGKPEVKRLYLKGLDIRLHKRTDGAANWKTTRDPAGLVGAFVRRFGPCDLHLDDAVLHYANDSTRTRCSARIPTLRLRQREKGPRLRIETERLSLVAGRIPLLHEASVDWRAQWSPRLEKGRWKLEKNDLRLNAIRTSLEGWVDLGTERGAVTADLRVDGDRIRFKELLSLVPPLYGRDFRALVASGDIDLAARMRGRFADGCTPAFEVKIGVRDGRFQYTSLPEAFHDIRIEARIAHTGGSADALTVEIPRFEIAMAGNSLRLTLSASELRSDPRIGATVAGRLDLAELGRAYPLDRDERRGGLLMANVRLTGRRSEVAAGDYDAVDAAGTFVVEGFDLPFAGMPPLHVRRAAVALRPEALTLGELDLRIGESDLAAAGKLTGYLEALFGGATLQGDLYTESTLLDLNELLGDEETGRGPGHWCSATRRLDLDLRSECRTLRLGRAELGGVRSELRAKRGGFAFDGRAASAFGGNLTVTGSCRAAEGAEKSGEARLRMMLGIDSAAPKRLFAQMPAVRHFAPLFGSAEGSCSMHLDMRSRIDRRFAPDPATLEASGTLEARGISAAAPELLGRLADTLRRASLRRIDRGDLRLRFAAADGTLRLDPLELRSNGARLRIAGCTGADGSLAYVGRLELTDGKADTLRRELLIGGQSAAPHIVFGEDSATEAPVADTVSVGASAKRASDGVPAAATPEPKPEPSPSPGIRRGGETAAGGRTPHRTVPDTLRV